MSAVKYVTVHADENSHGPSLADLLSTLPDEDFPLHELTPEREKVFDSAAIKVLEWMKETSLIKGL